MKHLPAVTDDLARHLGALRHAWRGCRLVPGGTNQVPALVRGRVCRVDARLSLMVGLRPGLRYRSAAGTWQRLGADEIFVMRGGQWQERDIARTYDQLKLAFHAHDAEVLRNCSGTKSGLRIPAPDPRRWNCLLELAESSDPETQHAALALLLAELERGLGNTHDLPSPGQRRFDVLIDHVREHLADEHSREALAQVAGCHPTHITRLFIHHAGCSYSTWLERQRLALVQVLLRSTELTLDAIAERSGFASANYLIRRFRAAFGVTPTRWRDGR